MNALRLQRMQGHGHAAVGDLGGSIITGIDGNPLAVLAAQLNIPLHEINTAGVPLYLEDGRVPDPAIDKKVCSCALPKANLEFVLKCQISEDWQLLITGSNQSGFLNLVLIAAVKACTQQHSACCISLLRTGHSSVDAQAL